MFQDDEYPPVVFRVKFGKEQFTCRGRLARDGGIVYATVEEMPDDCPFPPDRVKIEEDDLELMRDSETGETWYQYHGFVFVY